VRILFLHIILFQTFLTAQPKAKAELFYFSNEVNKQFALWITLEKEWHLYWLNSGDSGIPTEINWELPEGLSIIKSHWPVPKAFEVDGFVSYGYEKKLLILYDVIITDSSQIFNKEIKCIINSLICKDICIPFDTTITTKLYDIQTLPNLTAILSENNIKFPEDNYQFDLKLESNEDKVILEIANFNSEQRVKEISFFPFENGIFRNVLNNNFNYSDDKYYIELLFDQFKTHSPEKLEGLLIMRFDDESKEKAVKVSSEINKD
jgi:thiol:disulfide interchange protein DsbD